MPSDSLTALGRRLLQLLDTMEAYDAQTAKPEQQETYHVQNTGHIVSSLYEQLRNASENTEEHLLLQRAIRRYYARTLPFIDRVPPKDIAEELVTELTLAEYIANDTVTLQEIRQINDLAQELVRTYWRIVDQHSQASDRAKTWTLDLLAVRTEHLLHHPIRTVSYLNFVYAYYAENIDLLKHPLQGETLDERDSGIVLYMALHAALLKSDSAATRSMLLDLYRIDLADTAQLIAINAQFDRLSKLKTTDRLTRFINRNGAQARIIRRAFFDGTASTAKPSLLSNRKQVGTILRQTIEDEYRDTKKTLSRGIVKSIVFLLITKAVIGLAIEIPYDLAVHNAIAWIPLVINLFFPALFIALTTLTLTMPGEANTVRIVQTIDGMLYEQAQVANQLNFRSLHPKKQSTAFSIAYAVLFVVVVGAVIQGLLLLHFNIAQIIIFIVFLSTAAFLGYRLSLQVKALEIVSTESSFFSVVRDFLYTPFIFMGHQISSRYAKINLVARLLDNAIELPLKTSLRLIRQWTNFLSNKKDELL